MKNTVEGIYLEMYGCTVAHIQCMYVCHVLFGVFIIIIYLRSTAQMLYRYMYMYFAYCSTRLSAF